MQHRHAYSIATSLPLHQAIHAMYTRSPNLTDTACAHQHVQWLVLLREVHKHTRSPEHFVHELSKILFKGLAALVVRVHVVGKVQDHAFKLIVVHRDRLLLELELFNLMCPAESCQLQHCLRFGSRSHPLGLERVCSIAELTCALLAGLLQPGLAEGNLVPACASLPCGTQGVSPRPALSQS